MFDEHAMFLDFLVYWIERCCLILDQQFSWPGKLWDWRNTLILPAVLTGEVAHVIAFCLTVFVPTMDGRSEYAHDMYHSLCGSRHHEFRPASTRLAWRRRHPKTPIFTVRIVVGYSGGRTSGER